MRMATEFALNMLPTAAFYFKLLMVVFAWQKFRAWTKKPKEC